MAQEDLLKHCIFRQRQRDTRYHREQSYCAIYGSTVCAIAERTKCATYGSKVCAIAERTNCATYDSKLCALGDRTKRLLLSHTRAMTTARNVCCQQHRHAIGGSARRMYPQHERRFDSST